MARKKSKQSSAKVKHTKLVKSRAPPKPPKLPKVPKAKLFSSAEQRRAFRHQVAVLKKRGLISKSVDARKALPTRDLKKTLKLFDDVLRGEARVFTLPASRAKEYKKIDYKVRRNKIVVPKSEYVAKTKEHGFVVREKKQIAANAKATIDILPIRPDDVESWLKHIETTHAKKLKGNQRYAFRYYGNNSRSTFQGIEQLTHYLRFYDSVQRALSGDQRANVEVPRNVDIITVDVRKYGGSDFRNQPVTRGAKPNATGRNSASPKTARYLAGRAAYMRKYRAAKKKT